MPHETVSFYPDERGEDIRRTYKAHYYADYEVRLTDVPLHIRQLRPEGLTDEDTAAFRDLLLSLRTEMERLVRSCSGKGDGHLLVREPGQYRSTDGSGRTLEETQTEIILALSMPGRPRDHAEMPPSAETLVRMDWMRNALRNALCAWNGPVQPDTANDAHESSK